MWTQITWERETRNRLWAEQFVVLLHSQGGCHVAGDGGGEAWLRAEAALLAPLRPVRWPSGNVAPPRLHQLILQRHLYKTTTVKLKLQQELNNDITARLRGWLFETAFNLQPAARHCNLAMRTNTGVIKHKYNSDFWVLKCRLCAVQKRDPRELSLCSLSSCAMCRRGSPPARWQVLGKGRALAPSTWTCSQKQD